MEVEICVTSSPQLFELWVFGITMLVQNGEYLNFMQDQEEWGHEQYTVPWSIPRSAALFVSVNSRFTKWSFWTLLNVVFCLLCITIVFQNALLVEKRMAITLEENLKLKAKYEGGVRVMVISH